MTMRILFVDMCEDGTTGGSHRALLDLATHLDRTAFVPVVLFYQANSYVAPFRAHGIHVETWDEVRARECARLPTGARLARLVEGITRRVALLRRLRINIVHLNNMPTQSIELWQPACCLARVRLISHVRGVMPRAPTGERLDSVRRGMAARCERLIAVSRHVAAAAVAAGMPRGRLTTIYDGVDLSYWRPGTEHERQQARASLALGESGLGVVLPGNLKRWKGQLSALEAFRLLPAHLRSRTSLYLAGAASRAPDDVRFEGEVIQFARALTADGGPQVTLLGPQDDMRRLYAAADLVLHCSVSPEPFGLVVVEALAMGCPVVASNLGGPAEILTPESGLLADPREPQALASVLERVLCSEPLRASLSAGARRRAMYFALERTTEQLAALYLRRRVLTSGMSGAVAD